VSTKRERERENKDGSANHTPYIYISQTNASFGIELEITLFFAALNSSIEHFIDPILIFEARI
jgi:hypothetical protein